VSGSGNHHDALFKRVFSEPELASGLLQVVVPPAAAARLDWRSLRPEPASFVDDRLGDRHADLLFSASLDDGRDAFLYLLLEHQSGSDPFMVLRMLRYMVRIWERYLREHPDATGLPVVVPVVFHHSETGWTAPTAFAELLDADIELLDALDPHIPRLRLLIDDLSAADDAALRARSHRELALVALSLLVRARHNPSVLGELRRLKRAVEAVLAAPNGVGAVAALFAYTLAVGEDPAGDVQAFAQSMGPDATEAFMTGAQQLIEQGRAEGRAAEKVAIVLHLLDKKFGPLEDSTIERVRGASAEELDHYVDRILVAATIADVID
jgi:predicted transposase/invertase (TIGR01784 family)